MSEKWFFRPKPNPSAKLRLFCLPYSGAGAFAFRQWQQHVPPTVEVVGVHLPGRDSRFREAPQTSLQPLLDGILDALTNDDYLDRPFAIFGHSLGALLAFELARELEGNPKAQLMHLFPSARVAPQSISRDKPIHQLPEDEFIDCLRHFNGTSDAILENKELMDNFLPILRADFQVNETYQYVAQAPLECPISVYWGSNDVATCYQEVVTWAAQTSSQFMVRTLTGGHFYINNQADTFWRIFSHDLNSVVKAIH